MNLLFSKYGRNRGLAHTITRHARCVVWCQRPVSIKDFDQHSIGLTVLSGCNCKRTQPHFTSQGSVSNVRRLVKVGSLRRYGDVSASSTTARIRSLSHSAFKRPRYFFPVFLV